MRRVVLIVLALLLLSLLASRSVSAQPRIEASLPAAGSLAEPSAPTLTVGWR